MIAGEICVFHGTPIAVTCSWCAEARATNQARDEKDWTTGWRPFEPSREAVERAGTKRFFRCDFGIDYVIVAADAQHALEVLREAAESHFDETLAECGEPVIVELPVDEASKRLIWDDGENGHQQVPLASLQLGEWASSEW